jgi:hypothetical protein
MHRLRTVITATAYATFALVLLAYGYAQYNTLLVAYAHFEQGGKTYARGVAITYDGPGLITQRVRETKAVRVWPRGQRSWGELRAKAFEHATTDETRWGVTTISGDDELKTPRGATIVSWWWFLVPTGSMALLAWRRSKDPSEPHSDAQPGAVEPTS